MTLSSTSPFNAGTLWLTAAQEKAIGLLPSNASGIDGYVGISDTAQFSDSAEAPPAQNQYYLIGVLEHEFTEVMGRISYLGEHVGGTNSYGIMDLFRFAAPGERQLSPGGPAYFSIDGGNIRLDTWNTNASGDLGDWATGTAADAFLAFSSAGQINSMTATDLSLMNVIGWNTSELGVTQIQVEGLAITRTIVPPDQATSIANSINSGLETHAQFINNLLSQVTDTTIPALAVEASMYGAVGSSNEVTFLTTQYLPAQVAVATAYGLNPVVYSSEALGLAFAAGNEAGSTAFANQYGPSNSACPIRWPAMRRLRPLRQVPYLVRQRLQTAPSRSKGSSAPGRRGISPMAFRTTPIRRLIKLIWPRAGRHGVMPSAMHSLPKPGRFMPR